MLLAIDLGNTETHVGAWDGAQWRGVWRRPTKTDGFSSWLHEKSKELESPILGAIIASVVPAATEAVVQAVESATGQTPELLTPNRDLGVVIKYDPPGSLGADRLANVLGAKAKFELPILIVDIGTATTFEAVDRTGAFVGGAIMPGPALAAGALVGGTAALPEAILETPPFAIGTSTMAGLQSGIMLGHAAAIQGLTTKMVQELGAGTTVVATGGLGAKFVPLCPIIAAYSPTLTLDGLIDAYRLLTAK